MAARAAIDIFFMLVSSYKVIWTPKLTFLVFGKRLPVVPATLCSGSVPRLTAWPKVRRVTQRHVAQAEEGVVKQVLGREHIHRVAVDPRNAGTRVLRGPGVQQVGMELEALAVGRHLGVVGVVHQAADAVVEHHGQVHTADLEGVGETAEHVRDRAAEVLLLLVAGDVGSAFRQDAVHDHAVAVGIVVEEVHPELVVTVGGVHAGVFRAPVVVAAPALAPFEHARVHLLLRQGGDDVAVVGGVEVHVPPEAVLVHGPCSRRPSRG